MSSAAEARNAIQTGALSRIAPAKINLALHITGQRDDGYHLIETLCVFSDFGDRLSVEPSGVDTFDIEGPFSGGLSAGEPNLVEGARDLLRAAFSSADCPPVAIRLEKNLPVASGIGGGSSDAAATLLLLSGLWNLPVGRSELAALGLKLGADVPMCLAGEPLVARGIGDILEPLPAFPPLTMLLANPGVAVSTRDVFALLADKNNPSLPDPAIGPDQAAIGGWLETTRNDLQAPAEQMTPEIRETVDLLAENGAVFARMSGSGATCFGIFADERSLSAAEETIAKLRPQWFVKAIRTGGSASDRLVSDN